MVNLATPIESAPKISPGIKPALKRLGIRTIRDLLFHFPARYDDFSQIKTIRDVVAGETVTVQGVIKKVSSGRTAHKRMALTEAVIEDETGRIKALWFNQPFLARTLKPDTMIRLSGKITFGKSGLFLSSPAHEKITGADGIHTGGLVPVYPETDGISSRWLRFLISSFLPLAKNLADPLPAETRKKYDLPELAGALHEIHFPRSHESAQRAEHRFIFEELLFIQLRAMRERARIRQRSAPAIAPDVALIKQFVSSLPFPLTDAQRRSIWEIMQDMARPHPMNRLLDGDVGSGKTVVAATASLLVARAGYRVAFMVPTEILARQHYATISRVLAPFHVSVGILTGSEKKRNDAHTIIVGTHALIQKNTRLENLGLVVVDEQHRFGVTQRAALLRQETRNKRQEMLVPHFLSMTATPIPRTLALTIYGDLDLSVLDEMPAARKPVITKIISPAKRSDAYQFIREEVKRGRQVFVICPRIERGTRDKRQETKAAQQKLLLADVKTVTQEHRKLSEDIFPDLKIAMLHGRMKAKQKEAVMHAFHERETDILVSTSVVEVGVDVPNATIMMIEGAEWFGLAQLHQFRGRVGRGEDQSYCFLFPTEDGLATRRLKAVVDAKNGFELAEKDLAIRGPGDMFGTEQWGEAGIAFKGLSDPALVRDVRAAAMELAQKSPDLSAYPGILLRLQEMERNLHME